MLECANSTGKETLYLNVSFKKTLKKLKKNILHGSREWSYFKEKIQINTNFFNINTRSKIEG